MSFNEFFDICHAQGALRGPMLALGCLRINQPESEIQKVAIKYSYPHLMCDLRSVRAYFLDRYGIDQYLDCDLNDMADLRLDFNKPIPREMAGSFNTLLNGGTLEHIMDVRAALQNIHSLVKSNGVIIHLAPLTWYDHGYYNFNPMFFKAVGDVNRYQLVAEAFHFIRNELIVPWRRRFSIYLTYDGKRETSFRQKVDELLRRSRIPANVLYMAAYRKHDDAPFSVPYDIQQE
ncbi:MAG: hypothetical protein LAP85_11765 [Acidobacteriia bacterium]|nr:hypothetical protein [Terriglobia bacterium]